MKRALKYRPPTEKKSWLATLLLLVMALLFVYPFFWMFLAGFKTNREIFRPLQVWPAQFDTQYYAQLFREDWFPFVKVFFNSLVVAFCEALGAVVLTSLAGYVFARHRFRGRRILFLLSVVVIVIPQQAMAIPLFTWLNTLHLSNRLLGVILPGMVTGLGILYFTQVFRQIPDELVEAARLAGASEFRVYWTLLPLITSALLSFGFIQFILAWHDHLIPLLVLSSAEQQTLPLALSSLYGSSLRYPYAVLMAASALTVLPTVILFCLLYRRFRNSLSELLVH
jgi:multiple sugar transport system permease protein